MSKAKTTQNEVISDSLEANLDDADFGPEQSTQTVVVEEIAELEEIEDSRWIKSQDVPNPLRRSDLTKLAKKFCAENGLDYKDFDEAKFQREQGLPNPTRLYRVSAFKSGSKAPIAKPAEIDAVDAADAIRLYKEVEQRGNADLARLSVRFETAIVKE